MATYVMLTRVSPDALKGPQAFETLGRDVAGRLEKDCPEVRWISSYSVLGPYDYVDVFEAPDESSATKVALIVRSFGHATTEIWPALPWPRFRELARELGRRS